MPEKLTSGHAPLLRYSAALAAVGACHLVRVALTRWCGPGLPTYITYYPAVMIVALAAGIGPGLAATAAAALAADYWVIPPAGFTIEEPIDAVGLVIFSGMGVFMSVVAEYLRRAQHKAMAYDREQALRETRRQNEFLAQVIERSSQPFGVGYPDGRLGLINRAFERLTGYTAGELHAMDWAAALTPPEWRELERQKLEELHRTGQPVRYEKEYLRKDGTRVPIELLVHLARDAQGQPEYYYSFLADITERRQAEDALQRERNLLRTLIDLIPDVIYVRDAEDRFLLANAMHARLVGARSHEEMLGKTDADFYGAGASAAFRADDQRVLAGATILNQEEPVASAAGGQRLLLTTKVPLKNSDGVVVGLIGVGRDITERKRDEEVLHQLNTELRQRVADFQAANEALQTSRKAALNLMEDALQARKLAEQATGELRSTAEQRRLAIEAADLGTWDYQFRTGEVQWDQRCREMWGFPQVEHLDYSTTLSGIHPDDRPGVDDAVQQALAGKDDGAYHREFRVVWPDGSEHWIASHGRVYFEGEGGQRRAVRFIGANHDITVEKEALEALRESEERLAAFAAATFEGIVLSDQGRIVDCNHQFVRMIGCTAPEVIGSTIADYVPPEDRPRVVANIHAGRESITEHQMLRRDGSRLIVEAHGHPSHPARSGLRHTAIRDITESKRREEQLRQLNRTLTALKDSSVAMLHATSEADYLNEVCQILADDCGHALVWIGLAEDDPAKTVRPVAHAGFEEGYLETLHITWADTDRGRGPTGAAIRTGQPCACAHLLTDPRFAPWRPEALKRGYASSLVVPLLTEGRAFGAITLYSQQPDSFSVEEVKLLTQLADDVSYCVSALRLRAAKARADRERERAQAELQQTAEDLKRSNRDLEQFAYIASHDLQEPLRAVAGYVKLLQLRFRDKLDAKAQGYIAGASEGATRMERLIGDLLAYSRVGTRGGEFAPADLNAALAHALDNLRTAIASAHATITHDPLPTLAADATQVTQLFQNLIGNALKFRGDQPPGIHIGAQRQAGRWVFSVRDNGIGIEPQYLEKIFQIFQRLHTRKDYPGTGIGLAICKKIVERHGGAIWVESQPGQGATFCLTIPEALGKRAVA